MMGGAPINRGAEVYAQGRLVAHPGNFSFAERQDGGQVLNRISTPLGGRRCC
tara:strand:+ start:247 stop:402 length:156 start_codon:yes stop_codon:yes gene_type:complete